MLHKIISKNSFSLITIGIITMKKKAILSFLVLSIFVASIITSDLTKGAVASDNLEINKGSYVKGNYLITNNTHTNEFLWNIEIEVEKSFKPKGSSHKLNQIKVSQNFSENEELAPFEGMNRFEMTYLIFEHNRTTLLIAGRFFVSNSTWSVEISTLHHSHISDLVNENKTRITFGNGTSYNFEDVEPIDPVYSELASLVNMWDIYNHDIIGEMPWTILAISPKAQTGDTITFDEAYGNVVDTPDLLFLNLGTFNTIRVEYVNSTAFFVELFQTVEVYYESKTGLLIKSTEAYPPANVTLKFVPTEIKITSNALPLVLGISISVVVVSALVVFYFKKRK